MTTGAVDAEPRNRPRSRRRSELTTSRLLAVSAIATVTAIVVTFTSDAAATGWGPADVLYRAFVAVATVAAASRARRWSLLIAAALVAVGLDGPLLAIGLAALVTAVVLAWRNRRNRVVGALVGALIAIGALELSWPASPQGATAVLAALALVPLWISGYRVSSTRTRKRITITALVFVALAAVGVASGAAFAVTQQSRLVAAADTTAEHAGRITSGDTDAAVDGFDEAAAQFASVVGAADSVWAFPARWTPVVAQNVDAVRTAAEAGEELNVVAADLAAQVDYDQLRLPDGRVDLDLLASYRAPVATAADTVAAADARLSELTSPWIAGPLQLRLDEFADELSGVRGGTDLAAAAVEQLPAMLGGDGPRRYLLLLGNPAEARDLGGHLGNWAEIVAVEGRLDVIRVGGPYELFGPGTEPRPSFEDDSSVPPAMLSMEPNRFPQNWSSSPDIATVTRVAAELYPQANGGAELDGVIYADPSALAALLAVTGPVTTSDGTRLDAAGAVEFLTAGQYVQAPDGSTREAAVTELVELALDRLTTSQLPSPAVMAEQFGPAVAGGHLQFHSLRGDDADLLGRAGLDRPIRVPDGGDLVAVVNRNANPSKIDTYLERVIDYDVDWDPSTGAVSSRVTVTMTNTVPLDRVGGVVTLPPPGAAPGTNRTQLSVLTPFRASGALVGDDAAPIGSTLESDGLRRHSVMVSVPPGGTVTVSFDLQGSIDPGPTYRLRWIEQPLVRPSESRLLLRSSGEAFPGGSHEGRVELGPDRVTDVMVSTRSGPLG